MCVYIYEDIDLHSMCTCMCEYKSADKCCSFTILSVRLHAHTSCPRRFRYWVSRSTENYYLIGQLLCWCLTKKPCAIILWSLLLKRHHHSPSQFLVKSFSHYLTICLIFMFFALRTLHTFLTPCSTAHTTFTASFRYWLT